MTIFASVKYKLIHTSVCIQVELTNTERKLTQEQSLIVTVPEADGDQLLELVYIYNSKSTKIVSGDFF